MGYKTKFYLDCTKHAFHGSIEQANTAAALLGGLIVLLILQYTGLKKLLDVEVPTTVGGTIAFTLGMAVVSVVLAWLVIFVFRLLAAPAYLYRKQQKLIESLTPPSSQQSCIEFEFKGLFAIEADQDLLYQIRRRYQVGLKNRCIHALNRCEVQLLSAIDSKGKEHLLQPLVLGDSFQLRPGEQKLQGLLAVTFTDKKLPVRVDPFEKNGPKAIFYLPNDKCDLVVQAISEHTIPARIELVLSRDDIEWRLHRK